MEIVKWYELNKIIVAEAYGVPIPYSKLSENFSETKQKRFILLLLLLLNRISVHQCNAFNEVHLPKENFKSQVKFQKKKKIFNFVFVFLLKDETF